MSNLLRIYGLICVSFATLTSIVASFGGWPAEMQRYLWHQLAFAAVCFLGSMAWKGGAR